jgi:hypothetical protein
MKELKFDMNDIVIVPEVQSSIHSRQECNPYIENNMLPIIAAPMDTVVSKYNYQKFIDNGIIPCIPRGIDVYSINSNLDQSFHSYGLKEIEDQLHSYLINDFDPLKIGFFNHKRVLLDIANGHMDKLVDIIKKIKQHFPNIELMVGNIANPKTFEFLAKAGADYVRAGIGAGAGCFVKGTVIKTKKGNKLIENIELDDRVFTHKNTYEKVYNIISYIENDDLIKINNTISTTNHKYYVLNKKYLNLVTDDNIHEYAEFIEAKKINNSYLLIQPTND